MYEDLMKLDNVQGAGIGKKVKDGVVIGDAVVVLVERKLPELALSSAAIIPKIYEFQASAEAPIEAVMTDVIEVGVLVAPRPLSVPTAADRKGRWRPIQPGISIAHFRVTAGTFGCIVYDEFGRAYILSNNHVMADSNGAAIGDPIYQPGPADGGGPGDTVAELHSFIPIKFASSLPDCPIASGFAKVANVGAQVIGSAHRVEAVKEVQAVANEVDCALARPVDGMEYMPDILGIGIIQGVRYSVLGEEVQKSGRTTGYTTGKVRVKEATVNVQYGDKGNALFEGCDVLEPMSAGGDSGSVVLGMDGFAVGHLFAGSPQATIQTSFQRVLDLLEVRAVA